MSKIIVKSVPPSFRRAGIAFSREGVVLDTDQLTPQQLAAIRAELQLVVADVAESKDEGKGGKAGK